MIKYSKIVPLGNRVLVQKVNPPSKTQGGILLPTKTSQKSNVGIVVSVGEGRQLPSGVLVQPTVKPGDYVLLPDYGGASVPNKENTQEENETVLYQEDDILGVLIEASSNTKI